MGFASGGLRGILGRGVSWLLLVVVVLQGSSFPGLGHAAEILYKHQSLALNESLQSAGGLFRLGFFFRGSSPRRYYLGIWYNTPGEAVVWVANRATPLSDTAGGRLTILDNGTLAVVDTAGTAYWSSNSTIDRSNSSARLEDDGAFVLRAGDGGSRLWSSLDHPTDAFIPKMAMTADPARRRATRFVSWRSPDDPAPGNYSLGLDPNGSGQLYTWNGEKLRWRSGQWNRESFIGITRMRPLSFYGFNLVAGDNGTMALTFSPAENTLLRFVMASDGVVRTFAWNLQSIQAWVVVCEQPQTECETYNFCGRNGVCRNQSSCSCLPGFLPRSELEWSAGDRSGGCVRRAPLGCRSNGTHSAANISSSPGRDVAGDAFARLDGVKLPDFAETVLRIDEDACAAVCSRNCTCDGYAYVTSIGCMVWTGDLVDLVEFPSGGKTLFLKLAGNEFTESDLRKPISKVVIIVVVMMSILLAFGIYISWKYKNKVKGIWKRNIPESALLYNERMVPRVEDCDLELPTYTFGSLSEATRNFSGSNMLGKGGFGPVYKGELPGGQEIAVKRLSEGSGQGPEEFKNEVLLIAKLQHINLVRLLGYCINEDERILVYEYMPNKSLDTLLFDSKRKRELDWKTRLNIIHGIARGLLYLHQDSRLRIIHRDLKASNILLDEEMNPKISDFGLARTFGRNQNEANTKRVVGTFGYMAPEYAMDGIFSIKSDVYSFGVLLLEIISARKSKIVLHSGPCMSLLGDAWRLWNEKKPMEFVDPDISESSSPEEVLRCMHIGLLCVQSRPLSRPTMASVVLLLSSEVTSYPTPEQPIFVIERGWTESDSSNNPETSSTNEITISVVTGR